MHRLCLNLYTATQQCYILQCCDVISLGTFLALSNLKRYLLTFSQSTTTCAIDCTEVYEYI